MARIRLRPVVRWFAEEMERTLRANDGKGGWGAEPEHWLLKRLYEEADELAKAIGGCCKTCGASHKPESKQRTIKEATDVANFAMMLADNRRGWHAE